MGKTCTICLKEKERSYFHKHPTTADKLSTACKACYAESDKKRNEVHLIKRYIFFLEERGYQVMKNNKAIKH